jgi:hypothetical protein
MSDILHIFIFAEVLLLEIDLCNLRLRNNPQIQSKRQKRNRQRSQEIGPHQTAETHTSRQHRNNLGLVGHLRSEEDYRNERKQATELVDKEGNKVDIIVKYDGRQWGFGLGKVVHTLGIVEDHQDDGNHRNGEDICTQELGQDIAVKNLESGERQIYSVFHFTLFYLTSATHLAAKNSYRLILLQSAAQLLHHLGFPR